MVNPKIATVFIPKVEELFYNHLGIQRPKAATPPATAETSNGKVESDLLPIDLEAVSPGSVKSNDGKEDVSITGDNTEETKMEIDEASQPKTEQEESQESMEIEKEVSQLSGISDLTSHGSESLDNSKIPLPAEINPENIPLPVDSPPKIELHEIQLPQDEDIPLPEIPLPDTSGIPLPETEKESYFKPIILGSEEDDSSSDSSLIRNMSPLTPVRNFDDENSCDAQQGFDSEVKADDEKPQPATFRFTIEANKSSDSSQDGVKSVEKKEPELNLSYQFESQVNLNTYNTPLYEDSSNSNNLQIDYESDVNSKTNTDMKLPEPDQSSQDVKKEKTEEKKSSSHKSSHRSRDSHRHSSSSKDKRADSKHSSSRDKDSKHDKKSSSKDERSSSKSKSSRRDKSPDRSDKSDKSHDKKDSRDSSKQRHSSSHKSSGSSRDTKHRSSSSSQRHSSSKRDDKTPSSSNKDKSSSRDNKSKDSKSSSSKLDKDRKSSSSKKDDKDKKDKKDTDDHYSLSGRGNIHRRSTDRDSNDGNSTSSKGSNIQSRNTESNGKKEKSTSSKSETTSSSSGTSPSDKDVITTNKMSQARNLLQAKSAVRVENHLETTLQSPVRFLPEVVLKKPKFASNFEEAKKMMKMRKFLDEEQRRMNQEAALLLEFQANVRPSMSQVYSNISGPELEFACGNSEPMNESKESNDDVLQMEEVCIEDLVIDDQNSDTETIESLADIQKEVDEITLSTGEIKDEEVKAEISRTSDELLKDLSETEDVKQTIAEIKEETIPSENKIENPNDLKYFNQTEKYNAEIYRDTYSKFLQCYNEKYSLKNKLHLFNCSKYEEDIFREIQKDNDDVEIITYYKNGHSYQQKPAKYVDFNNTEITIPISNERSSLLSPVKSECSFELSSDYDARLEDMMQTTSRQQIMEIILGGALDDSSTKMPTIDICNEADIESVPCKRRLSDVEGSDNNNRQVLTPNKIRKLSGSAQITSTTEGVFNFFLSFLSFLPYKVLLPGKDKPRDMSCDAHQTQERNISLTLTCQHTHRE